ncbi:MAG: ATP-binding cassette domain-containing protein [Flavitalea sp.]
MIIIDNVSVVLGGQSILSDIGLSVPPTDVLCVVGGSGSGKTSLAKVLTGSLFHSGKVSFKGFNKEISLAYVPQEHQFRNLTNTSDFYYQQRFNASESDQSMKVCDFLAADNPWIDVLRLRGIYDRPILQLSNGENKRLQLAQRLQGNPDVLILDNPFLGLDVSGRQIFEDVLKELIASGIQVILLAASHRLPSIVTRVVYLDSGKIVFDGTPQEFDEYDQQHLKVVESFDRSLLSSLSSVGLPSFEFAIAMRDVHIQYDSKVVLDGINWEVLRGERWSLSGPNGAGKSSLLSLVTGDNPQAYANDIVLFDRKRGSGESIWDIKKNIGFVSPELHLYFDQGSTCYEVIASGLFDTIGLFRVLSDPQKDLVDKWMDILHLRSCRNKPLRLMSRGEQRLSLLGRALIKMPAMLVLDEPCQGLDEHQTGSFASLIDVICAEFGTTLIYISHFVQEIPSCVTKFIRLENGRQV